MPQLANTLLFQLLDREGEQLRAKKDLQNKLGMDVANAQGRQIDYMTAQDQREQDYAKELGASAAMLGESTGQPDYTGGRASAYEALGAMQGRGQQQAAQGKAAGQRYSLEQNRKLQEMLMGGRAAEGAANRAAARQNLLDQLAAQERIAKQRAQALRDALQGKANAKAAAGPDMDEIVNAYRATAANIKNYRTILADPFLSSDLSPEERQGMEAELSAALQQQAELTTAMANHPNMKSLAGTGGPGPLSGGPAAPAPTAGAEDSEVAAVVGMMGKPTNAPAAPQQTSNPLRRLYEMIRREKLSEEEAARAWAQTQ